MSRMRFRVNPYSIVARMLKNSLLKTVGWVFVYKLSGCGFTSLQSLSPNLHYNKD